MVVLSNNKQKMKTNGDFKEGKMEDSLTRTGSFTHSHFERYCKLHQGHGVIGISK